jgi:chitinase
MSLRNVIYYNAGNDQIPLGVGLNQLPYTDVIVANLQPTTTTDYTLKGWGNAFDDQLQNNIRWLQRANKNVLISFGGSMSPPTMLSTAAYQYWAANSGNLTTLVKQLVDFVYYYNFNGVDIDYEDDHGFGNNAAYDGVAFLSALTSQLYVSLPSSSKNIITHAPQVPYWDSHSSYARGGIAPYYQIWQNVGTKIAWYNNQFYDNSTYDKDAATKVEKYQAVAGLTGAQQALMGVSLSGDEGAETLSDMVQNVIPPLKAQYGSQFGGVVGWQFSYDQGGAWANGISQALGPGQP